MSKIYRIPTDEELNKLKATWKAFVPDGDGPSDQIFERLIEKYSEAHRTYHNVGHLVELFEYFENNKERFEDPQAIAFALLFHDVIYNIPGPDNEAQSAEYARQALAKLGIAPDIIARAADLIEMTKTHDAAEDDDDARLMLDMDMVVLGAPAKQYQKYCRAIEAEYVPPFLPEQYYAGRLQFLSSFSQKERLFLTDDFEERYGRQASMNIAAEHAQLKAKLERPPTPESPV